MRVLRQVYTDWFGISQENDSYGEKALFIIKEFRRNVTEEIEVGDFAAFQEIINSKEL